jgi:hypothetical protein
LGDVFGTAEEAAEKTSCARESRRKSSQRAQNPSPFRPFSARLKQLAEEVGNLNEASPGAKARTHFVAFMAWRSHALVTKLRFLGFFSKL